VLGGVRAWFLRRAPTHWFESARFLNPRAYKVKN
jgi:hypothetical protein